MGEAAASARSEIASDALQVFIAGKLVDQRRNDGIYYSTVLKAAEDGYSQPMPFEIRSTQPLGPKDALVNVKCDLHGFFRRTYNVTDQQTGEVRRVRPIVMALHAVESF